MRLPHLIGIRASPPHLQREGSTLPHLRQDQAHRCLICTGTELTAATSAPGLGSPLPHLRRDWAHRCHICARTVLKSVYGQRLRASDGTGIVGVAVVIRLVAPGRVGAQQGYPDSLSEPIEAFPIVRPERASHCRVSRIDFHRTERGPRSMRQMRWRRSREIARARASSFSASRGLNQGIHNLCLHSVAIGRPGVKTARYPPVSCGRCGRGFSGICFRFPIFMLL